MVQIAYYNTHSSFKINLYKNHLGITQIILTRLIHLPSDNCEKHAHFSMYLLPDFPNTHTALKKCSSSFNCTVPN